MLKRFLDSDQHEAGCDEAGRGCLAGPVTAAAVILPADYKNPLLNDSKKLTEKIRNHLRREIEHCAVSYAVSFIDNRKIDEVNILKASILGMHNALGNLSVVPEYILIDGNRFYKFRDIPHTCVVKGDGKYLAIAAASILAKTYRDEFMEELHQKHFQYGWNRNKGYPTKTHRQAIQEHGLTEFHRRSFQLLNTQMEISFGESR
ncbi:MAG: ribonuclease HII [Bacteroidales bacterium]|nr:ribonuclease HII [Bacteroidales bacterium]